MTSTSRGTGWDSPRPGLSGYAGIESIAASTSLSKSGSQSSLKADADASICDLEAQGLTRVANSRGSRLTSVIEKVTDAKGQWAKEITLFCLSNHDVVEVGGWKSVQRTGPSPHARREIKK